MPTCQKATVAATQTTKRCSISSQSARRSTGMARASSGLLEGLSRNPPCICGAQPRPPASKALTSVHINNCKDGHVGAARWHIPTPNRRCASSRKSPLLDRGAGSRLRPLLLQKRCLQIEDLIDRSLTSPYRCLDGRITSYAPKQMRLQKAHKHLTNRSLKRLLQFLQSIETQSP